MPSKFSENWMSGIQRADQHFADKKKREKDVEDRDWELKRRQAELKLENIQHQLTKRKLEQENVGMTQGQKAPEQTMPAIGNPESGLPVIPEKTMAAPLAPMQVSGVPELGVADTTVFPQSMQQQIAAQQQQVQAAREKQVFDSQLKREENTYTVPDPTTGRTVTGPKELLDNIFTQTGANARQVDQQAFTSEENRKRAEADEKASKAAADARLKAAQIAASARLAAAQTAGVSNKTTTRADAKVREFLQLPTVKKYSEVAEIIDYAANYPVQTANAADDYTLLVTHAKAVDPGSVAREGEVAAATKAAQSILEQFGINIANVITKNQSLTTRAREAVIQAINRKLAPNVKAYENVRNFYKAQIGSMPGLDPASAEDLIPRLTLPTGAAETEWKVIR